MGEAIKLSQSDPIWDTIGQDMQHMQRHMGNDTAGASVEAGALRAPPRDTPQPQLVPYRLRAATYLCVTTHNTMRLCVCGRVATHTSAPTSTAASATAPADSSIGVVAFASI